MARIVSSQRSIVDANRLSHDRYVHGLRDDLSLHRKGPHRNRLHDREQRLNDRRLSDPREGLGAGDLGRGGHIDDRTRGHGEMVTGAWTAIRLSDGARQLD